MNTFDVNRRNFCLGLLGLGLSPFTFAGKGASPNEAFLISAQGRTPGEYGVGWIDLSAGNKTATWNTAHNSRVTGFRGHGVSVHPSKPMTALMYGRRPARQVVEVSLQSGALTPAFACQPGRHLYGHGCFSSDGQWLFTTESDYKTGDGKIVVRDGRTYQWLAEYDSGGIGPHELKLLPDGKTLVVANGGILTHPDSGRKKLNLDTMASNLSYVESRTGKLMGAFIVPEPKASIRHLDVADDGVVAFGMQVQRSAADHNKVVPLAGFHKPGQAIELAVDPHTLIHRMNDYAGSVAISSKHRVAGFTSPRGNIAVFWHIDSRELIGYHGLHDVCGLAVSPDQNNFLISNSLGEIRTLDCVSLNEDKSKRLKLDGMHWDNHMLMASIL